ncbi:MAG: ATP-binding protein, partial [Actinobacteria bacterium]|nr:ATP-binding protein [Actinomycetota bacterium]
LSVSACQHGSRTASLVVQDTGTGIAADDLPHLFERFSTGSPAIDGRRGTGLGLSLVRAVAQGHGGKVKAESMPGLGSKFEIILPVAAVPVPLPTPRVGQTLADPAEAVMAAQEQSAAAVGSPGTESGEYRGGR